MGEVLFAHVYGLMNAIPAPLPAALVAVYSLTHLLPLRSAQYSSATLDFDRQTSSATARSPAGAARARGADLKARYLCTEGAKVPTIKGRLQSPRDINSRPAPKKATVAPPSHREHAMPTLLRERKRLQVQDNIPPVCPPCPTCGKEMTLVSVTPAMESVVFGYLCANDHVLEFTIGDR